MKGCKFDSSGKRGPRGAVVYTPSFEFAVWVGIPAWAVGVQPTQLLILSFGLVDKLWVGTRGR